MFNKHNCCPECGRKIILKRKNLKKVEKICGKQFMTYASQQFTCSSMLVRNF